MLLLKRVSIAVMALACVLPRLAAEDELPDYIVAEFDVPATMRDGTILRANVFRPKDGGPFPVLVMRTPYGKPKRPPLDFVRAGYIVVTQDCRGRYASDGEWESFVHAQTHEPEDGYDTIEWAAKLPNSTGKVGTFGSSYNAWTQWKLTALNPPSLKAMAAFSIPAKYQDVEGPGTIRPGRRLKWWYTTMTPDMNLRAKGPLPHTVKEANERWDSGMRDQIFATLPLVDLPDEIFGHEAKVVKDWLRDPTQEPWHLEVDAAKSVVPNLNVCGWYDHCNGSIDLHSAITQHGASEQARKGSCLVVGPWSHSGLGKRELNGVDFGAYADFDLNFLQVDWFDYWLKSAGTDAQDKPEVIVYVIGAEDWRELDAWPPRDTQPTEMFLTSGGSANTPKGNGTLGQEPAQDAADHYVYDPSNPVPTLWERGLFTTVADQTPLADRQDILVYQSAPLEDDLEVIGYPEVVLHAASDAPDTDFHVRLIIVSPEGPPINVADGMVRARYRGGLDKPELIKPGEIVEYRIRMHPTGVRFKQGDRIRLDVTSSDYPNYERNHNTAANQNLDSELRPAKQTIHHGPAHPSKLVLPVVPPSL